MDVRNEKNGRAVRVRINDRGPFVAGRVVDLSKAAAAEIGAVADGVVPVTLTVVTLGTGKGAIAPEAGDVSRSGPLPSWAVQAGAFGDGENARALRDRLAARYPNPYLEEFRGLTRVKLGPYRTRDEADEARQSLAELGLAGIVVPYR